jgi:hypothetical protein
MIALGGPDCDLLCSWDVVEPMRASAGPRTFQIPNQPSLLGARVYQQYILYYLVVGQLIFDFWIVSNGGEMVIGR